ncbi:hypothetical protein PIIN_01205 [Serendipita indica DSM 11827]|uniref:Uncharacterized protein n=1 Tax=Serendipita indica (strain DSM 11827) TaxID=1109443 RepID=G4T7T6_SERID|nr:hypothetical protein PIIN_01205 [Serendipita indica DSM 11827]
MMGEVFSKPLPSSTDGTKEEQLAFLLKGVSAKLDKDEADLHEILRQPDTAEKKTVSHIIRALPWHRGYHMDKFVSTSPSTLPGNNQAGEIEEQKLFMYVEHNTVIRIDTRACDVLVKGLIKANDDTLQMWKYNFSRKGIIADVQNVFGCEDELNWLNWFSDKLLDVLCSSVVDPSTLEINELVYLLSEFQGDKNVGDYINQLISPSAPSSGQQMAPAPKLTTHKDVVRNSAASFSLSPINRTRS